MNLKFNTNITTLLKKLLFLTVIITVAWYIWLHIGELKQYEYSINFKNLLLAVSLVICGHLINLLLWILVSKNFNIHTSWKLAGRAWFLSRLGRYIPGKLPAILVRFNIYNQHSKITITAASFVEMLSAIIAASILISLVIWFYPSSLPSYAHWVALGFITVGTLMILPSVIKYVSHKITSIFNVPPLTSFPSITKMAIYIAIQFIIILIHGAALFYTFNTIDNVSYDVYLIVTATFFFAGLIGMAAIFSPSGIGVREAVLFFVLPSFIPTPTIIIGAILIRLITMFSETLLAIFFMTIRVDSSR